jgi:hypothetical protein
MVSTLNHQTASYVIMNHQSQHPSVSYSTQQSNQKELNKLENGIQTIVDTPLQTPHIMTRSSYSFTRAIQV